MYEFHKDKKGYFEMQTDNAKKSVIPFISEKFDIKEGMKVFEVGCAEGGVLRAFVDIGCIGVGVELDTSRVEFAQEFNQDYIAEGKMKFVNKNIYDPSLVEEYKNEFDIIVLKDVIEHIPDQEKIMAQFKHFMKPNGVIYFGFPPFNMPFGGHQQISQSKWFSYTPYTHLLPMNLYKLIIRKNEREAFVEIKETGISTARFEKICKTQHYKIVNEKFFLINPIYEYKFGLKTREQFSVITAIPHLRDFITTCAFYLIANDNSTSETT